jgi:glycosyltransferase involved in cell wall biosynthesis
MVAGHGEVCLMTEGTYPHHEGGVSVWCDQLVRGMPEVTFIVDAISATGTEHAVWAQPANNPVRRAVALWRTLDDARPAVRPGLEELAVIDRFLCTIVDRADADETLDAFRSMHGLARAGRLGPTILSQASVELTLLHMRRHTVHRPIGLEPITPPTVGDAVASVRSLEHLLRPLAAPPFASRLSHTAANGLSVLLAMSAAWEHGTPFLLTEHGMYLRERFIAVPPDALPFHQRAMVLGFLQQLTTSAYRLATAIAPGSGFNRGWELAAGADDAKIVQIHNGVHAEEFWPSAVRADPTTIVWVGRLDPLKDVKTMLRAFAFVAARRPDVRLRIFGGTPKGNEPYVRECKALHADLGLGDRAVFEGRVPSIVEAFHAGNVVVSTSISEGFPYSVLEAMASGRAVVATDVGGVAEAIGDAGVMVRPRDHLAIADACLALLDDAARTARLGDAARRRVTEHFTLALCLERYRELYASIDDTSVAPDSIVTEAVRVGVGS